MQGLETGLDLRLTPRRVFHSQEVLTVRTDLSRLLGPLEAEGKAKILRRRVVGRCPFKSRSASSPKTNRMKAGIQRIAGLHPLGQGLDELSVRRYLRSQKVVGPLGSSSVRKKRVASTRSAM